MTKKTKIWLCVALCLIIVGSFLSSAIRTSGFSVQLVETYIPDNDGTFIHATIFRPKTATAENPAPVVITCHGYSDSGEKQDFAAIELSRRGVVVFEMDALSHGLSSTSTIDSSPGSTFGEGCGMFRIVDFIMASDIDYIDKTQLGITGHSMGGLATFATYEHYGEMEAQAIEAAKDPESDGGEEITVEEQLAIEATNPITAAFPQSALPSDDINSYGTYFRPIGINYTIYDEGNYSTVNGDGDLRDAPEALAFVNSVLPESEQVSEVEIGKYYGDVEDGTLRVVYNPVSIHTQEYLTPSCATNLINFFSKVIDVDTSIPAENTIFIWRFVFSGLALLGLAILIPLLAYSLLKTKFFSLVAGEVKEAKMRLETRSDSLIFWGSWVLLAVITVLLLVPVIKLDAKLFPVVAQMGYAKYYTSVNVNSFAIWDVFIALITLVLFLVIYNVRLKKNGWTIDDLGLKINGKKLLRTIMLALAVGCIFYVITYTVDYIFHIDLRFWAISAKKFNIDKLAMFVQYLPWFFVYMFVQALVTNSVNRVAGQKNNLLINVVGNIAGLAIIVIFAYVYLFSVGYTFPAWQTAWDRVMQCVPFMVYAASSVIITRKCFEKTGNIWLGTFINSTIVTMMLVSNTSMFLTLH